MARLLGTVMALVAFAQAGLAQNRNACFDYAQLDEPGSTAPKPCASLDECQYELKGRQFALLIGIDAYTGTGLSRLTNAARDARDLAGVLSSAKLGYEVRCVLNPTEEQFKAEIKLAKSALGRLASNGGSASGARFLFYFSGHGYEQSQTSTGYGYIGTRNAMLTGRQPPGFLSVEDDIVIEFMHAGRGNVPGDGVHPIILIDACRNNLPQRVNATGRSANSGRAADSTPPTPHYYLGFAVAKDRKARDDDKRFMRFLLPRVVERGHTIHSIFNEAALDTIWSTPLTRKQGPWHSSRTSTILTSEILRPVDERCDLAFTDAWDAVDSMRPFISPDLPLHRILADGLVIRNKRGACRWSGAVESASKAGGACLRELQERFSTLTVESDCASPIVVASLDPGLLASERIGRSFAVATSRSGRSSAPPGEPRIAARNRRLSASDDEQPGADRWRDTVLTTKPVTLRFQPGDAARLITRFAKGQRLTVDCRSLVCSPEWIGVTYDVPGRDETWRGFVPADGIRAETARRTLNVAFEQGSARLTDASAAALRALAADAAKVRAPRWRVTASFVGDDSGALGMKARSAALDRVRSIDLELAAVGAYTLAGVDAKRGFDLAKVEKAADNPVLVELFFD